jgi:hypothetical protein
MTAPAAAARSLAELQALVARAARGAGLPQGHAEELAAAVPYLVDGAEERGALRALCDALERPPTPVRTEAQAPLRLAAGHPVLVLTAAIDAALAGLGPVGLPPLPPALACALVCAASAQTGAALRLDDATLRLDHGGASAPAPRRAIGPVPVDPVCLARLEAFAARTLVPETDASRRRGAGAAGPEGD